MECDKSDPVMNEHVEEEPIQANPKSDGAEGLKHKTTLNLDCSISAEAELLIDISCN